MGYFVRPSAGDQWDRIPAVLRGAIGALLGIWLTIEEAQRFPAQAAASRVLTITTIVVVIGAIFYTLTPISRRFRFRLAAVVLLAACSVASLTLQRQFDAGAVGAFAAVIMSAGLGVAGMPIAAICAVVYVARQAVAIQHGSPEVTLGVVAGASIAMLAAYLGPVWSRYLWTMRTEAAATRERERIAREMHDVLAHTLSGLTVKLEATRLLADQRPGDPAVAEGVADAHRLAREGLLEARRAVSALRGDEVPGPRQLESLLHDFEVESRIRCRLEIQGKPVPLKP
ncbi:MAG: sensor histidine kinase, partial [Candidatus Dormibacteraceae bacterium]